MRYSLSICEKHYGTVMIEAKNGASACGMAQAAINEGNAFWNKTEIDFIAVEEGTL